MNGKLALVLVLLCFLPGPAVVGGFLEENEENGGARANDLVKKEEIAKGVEPPQDVQVLMQEEEEEEEGNKKEKARPEEEKREEVVPGGEALVEGGKEPDKMELENIDNLKAPREDYRFFHGFMASISVIIVSEIGDKTFFIAAIMAMKHSRWLVFGGALSALFLMTVLSVCLGFATMIIPRAITFYISTALLALFGVKMLYEGYKMDPSEGQEELEEVTEELRKREESLTTGDPEQGLAKVPLRRRLKFFGPLVSPIFLQAFSLTFLAEWGDRSQLTTIILGARENPLGVIIGGTLGHALCTALAVIGGNMVARRISVKTVTLIGGVVFLLFAVTAIFHAPTSD